MKPPETPEAGKGRRLQGALCLLLGLGLSAVLPLPIYALLGIPELVFDPSSYAALGEIWNKDISMEAKLFQEVEASMKIYQNGKDMYDLANYMSQHLTDKQFMKTIAADAGQLSVQGRYGANADVARVMNGDYRYGAQAGADVWSKASANPGDPGYLHNEKPGESTRLARYTTVGLADAATVNCLETLGKYRNYDIANRIAADALKLLHLDGSNKTNSQGAQQNINNGFAHQQLTEQQTANAFRACEVGMQIANNKFQGDNAKAQMNFEARIAQQRANHADSLDGGDIVNFMKGR